MTTASWNTPINHTSDAGFRAWGSEIAAKLAAIGLVQTADTGQINWVTVTRPGASTFGGYEIWRFNDSLQGSAPIFFKLEYGTGGSANIPRTQITVGTGSNGSGTITGQATAATVCAINAVPVSTVTNYQSRACAVDGAAWIATKFNASAAGSGSTGFFICRTCDSTGAPTATGFVLYATGSASGVSIPTVQAVRTAATATSFAATATGFFSMVVHAVTSSLDGADTQAYQHWMPTPKVAPVFAACTMISAESAYGTTFSTTLVGTTPRTYVSLSTSMGQGGAGATNVMCYIYE